MPAAPLQSTAHPSSDLADREEMTTYSVLAFTWYETCNTPFADEKSAHRKQEARIAFQNLPRNMGMHFEGHRAPGKASAAAAVTRAPYDCADPGPPVNCQSCRSRMGWPPSGCPHFCASPPPSQCSGHFQHQLDPQKACRHIVQHEQRGRATIRTPGIGPDVLC